MRGMIKVSMVLREVYPVKEILSRIEKEFILFNGDFVYMGDKDYLTFKEKGLNCESCTTQGKYFIKEEYTVAPIGNTPFKFGLYGQNEDGREVKIFTRKEMEAVICHDCLIKNQT